MLNTDKILTVKRILSALAGALIPKFLTLNLLLNNIADNPINFWDMLKKLEEESSKYLKPYVNIESISDQVLKQKENYGISKESVIINNNITVPQNNLEKGNLPKIEPINQELLTINSNISSNYNGTPSNGELQHIDVSDFTKQEKIEFPSLKEKVGKFLTGDPAKKIAETSKIIGNASDMASHLLVNNSDYAEDSWTNSEQRLKYDTLANSLAAFSPVGTTIGGAMKVGALFNDILGSKTQKFSRDQETINLVGGSYGGSVSNIYEAESKANLKYGLFEGSKKRKANKQIDEAKRLLTIMGDIAKDAKDSLAASTIMSLANNFNHLYLINGGYDLRYMRAAKSGAKIVYFKKPFQVELSELDNFQLDLSDVPKILKKGGTLLDKLDESVKQIPDNIEVVETNTTQKSVIPEGALHKNKHHLDEVGIDDSTLTKKGIPVIDNSGNQQAEIELNEIIFTLEVTKELESRYKEFYKEDTNNSRKDELAIEAGKLLWKEILYNTDDRTGIINSLQQGGTLSKLKLVNEEFNQWVKDVNPKYINDNYDLEAAFTYLPKYRLDRWKSAVNSSNPDYYLNFQDPTTNEYIYHLPSTIPYGKDDYMFLKKGTEKTNPEIHFETDTYHDGSNGLKDTHDLVYNEEAGRYFYKKKEVKSHKSGGTIDSEEIELIVKSVLLKILK